MKRTGLLLAALAVAGFASAPALARVTLADFPGGEEAIERLLEHVHKKKHHKIVVKRAGVDDPAPGGNGSGGTTPTSTGADTSVQPK